MISLEHLQENYAETENKFGTKSERQKYFLAACLLFDPKIDLNIALKLRPYGGTIGIENSSLDNYLKFSKVLRLHAILHDAAGFVKEYSGKGPGYVYTVHFPLSWCIIGHLSGILFCTIAKLVNRRFFNLLKC